METDVKSKIPALTVMMLSTFVVCTTAAFNQIISFDLKLEFNSIIEMDYQWVFPAFMIGECASMGLCAGFLDRYGRRIPFLIGSVVFLIGTLLCALSTNMTFLIFARVPQGFGAGIVIVTCIAQLFFELKEPSDRYLGNGILSLGFGAGMLVGVFIGRVAADSFGWRNFLWAVFIAQIIFILPCMRIMRNGECSERKPDIAGSVLLAVTAGYAVWFFQKVYLEWGIGTLRSMLGLGILLMLFIVIIIVEYYSPYSMANRVLKDRKIMIASLIMIVLLGCVNMGSVGWMIKIALFTYHMTILQVAPFFLALVFGAAITAVTVSKVIGRTGHRIWFLMSSLLTIIALTTFVFVRADESRFFFGLHLFLMGLAIGCLVSMLNGTIQNRTDKDSNGGYMSFAIAIRTTALWMGYNIYQYIVDPYMEKNLGATMEYWNAITGIPLPCDSMLPCILVTPFSSILKIIPDLTTQIGDVFAQAAAYGFQIMGLIFALIAIPTALFLVGSKKVL